MGNNSRPYSSKHPRSISSNRLLVLLFFVLSQAPIFAQKKVTEFKLSEGKPDKVFQYFNDSIHYIHCTYTKNYIVYPIQNPEKKIIIERSSTEKRSTFLHFIHQKNNLQTIYYDPKNHTIGKSTFDIANNTLSDKNEMIRLAQNEWFLKSYMDGQVFTLVALVDFKNAIKLYRLHPDNTVENFYIQTTYGQFFKDLTVGNEEVFERTEGPVAVDFVRSYFDNHIVNAYGYKKMYVNDQIIYFTFEEYLRTHIVQFDLKSKTSRYKKVQFGLDKNRESMIKQGASFVCDHLLFRVTTNRDQLNLMIIDLKTMKLKQNFNAYTDKDFTFKNGAFKEKSSGDEEEIIPNSSAYMRYFNQNRAGIAVSKDGENYYLEIGTYEESVSYGKTSDMWSTSMSPTISFGLGNATGPSNIQYNLPYNYYGDDNPYGVPSTQSINSILIRYFQSVINQSTLLHQPEFKKGHPLSYIRKYQQENFRAQPELIQISQEGKKYLFGYYSLKNESWNILEFPKE